MHCFQFQVVSLRDQRAVRPVPGLLFQPTQEVCASDHGYHQVCYYVEGVAGDNDPTHPNRHP